jgi:Tfp pilus assembly protein PilV
LISNIHFTIECLRLEINNAAGHEHRIQPIALRAAEVLAARLEQQYAGAGRKSARLDTVSAPAVNVDLSRTSNEQAANSIAGAWLAALALQMEA